MNQGFQFGYEKFQNTEENQKHMMSLTYRTEHRKYNGEKLLKSEKIDSKHNTGGFLLCIFLIFYEAHDNFETENVLVLLVPSKDLK